MSLLGRKINNQVKSHKTKILADMKHIIVTNVNVNLYN